MVFVSWMFLPILSLTICDRTGLTGNMELLELSRDWDKRTYIDRNPCETNPVHWSATHLWCWSWCVTMDQWVWCLANHPRHPVLASGGDDMTVLVWSTDNHQTLFTLHGHTDFVKCMTWHGQYPWLVSGSDDYSVREQGWHWPGVSTRTRSSISLMTSSVQCSAAVVDGDVASHIYRKCILDWAGTDEDQD